MALNGVKTNMLLYEMHCHSNFCSCCSNVSPADLVKSYKAAGYQGLVLTDHCSRGYTSVDRTLPWKEQADLFYNAYLEAKKVGDTLDFDVIFGLEYGLGEGKEALLYGIDLEFLYSCKNFNTAALPEISQQVHDYGGVIIAAHPMRHRPYIKEVTEPDMRYYDGFEKINYCDTEDDTALTLVLAQKYNGLIFTAGSDWHQQAEKRMAGIITENRIKSSKELSKILKSKNYKLYFNGMINEC